MLLIHRLVAEAFIGPRPVGLDVNHIDGVKSNNIPANLEYVTRSENNCHAYRTGLRRPKRRLSTNEAATVCQMHSSGVSQRKIATHMNCNRRTVAKVIKEAMNV